MTRRRVAITALAVGLLLLLLDQATQTWALKSLPIAEPFDSCNHETCIPILTPWLVLKRSTSIPLPLPGGSITWYAIGGVITIAIVAVILFARVRYPVHAVAIGLLLGGVISNLTSYIARGEVEKFIAINYTGSPHSYLNLQLVAYVIGGIILLGGAVTGSVRPPRRRPPPNPHRQRARGVRRELWH
jgi:lipoprotein signal peptidase